MVYRCDRCSKVYKVRGTIVHIRPKSKKNFERYDLCGRCLSGLMKHLNQPKLNK